MEGKGKAWVPLCLQFMAAKPFYGEEGVQAPGVPSWVPGEGPRSLHSHLKKK